MAEIIDLNDKFHQRHLENTIRNLNRVLDFVTSEIGQLKEQVYSHGDKDVFEGVPFDGIDEWFTHEPRNARRITDNKVMIEPSVYDIRLVSQGGKLTFTYIRKGFCDE